MSVHGQQKARDDGRLNDRGRRALVTDRVENHFFHIKLDVHIAVGAIPVASLLPSRSVGIRLIDRNVLTWIERRTE